VSKIVDEATSNWAQSKRSPDGVSEVCRVCTGKAARKVQLDAGVTKPKAGEVIVAPDRPFGFTADPYRNFDAFELEIDEYVAKLAALVRQPRRDTVAIDPILRALKAATRLPGDAMPGGQMKDERLAFKAFMRVLKPLVAGWKRLGPIHEDIIAALLSKERHVLLLASRDSAKSTLTAMMATWWLWRNAPQEVILIVSKSEKHAKKMLKAIRTYIDASPLLEELRPDDDQNNSAFELEVKPAKGKLGMSHSVACRGAAGQITGMRATRVICDDIETRTDATVEAVDKLVEVVEELEYVAVPGASITLLGTPQNNFSLYGRLKRSDVWEVHTARLFESDFIDGREIFESRWPDRFTPADIEAKKRSVGKRSFALHYRLDLSETADKEAPFKLGDLPVIDIDPLAKFVPIDIRPGGPVLQGLPRGTAADGDEWRAAKVISAEPVLYTQTVAAVDPAGGLKGNKSDAIGLAIVSLTQGGRAIIRLATGVRADTTREAISETARLIALYGTNQLLVEETKAGTFGMQLSAVLGMRGHPLRVEQVNTGGQRKGRRIIEALSPAIASGKLFIAKAVLEAEEGPEFVTQFTGVTFDGRNLRFDDIIDATSYAVGAVAPALAADEADFVAGTRFNFEELAKLGPRQCVLTEEELEWWAEESEAEHAIKLKIERAHEQQLEDLRLGRESPALKRYIDKLTAELRRLSSNRNNIDISRLRKRPEMIEEDI